MKNPILVFVVILLFPLLSFSQEKMSLQECIDYALKNNIQYQRALLDTEQKRITLKKDKYGLLPSLNGNFSQGLNYGRTVDPFSNSFTTQRLNSSSISLNANLTVFEGLQQQNLIKKSEYDLESSRFGKERTVNEVSLQVAQAYVQALTSKEQVKVAESQVATTQQLLERIKLRVEIGEENKIKQYELESQLASDKSLLVEAKNTQELAILRLKQTINWDLSKPFDIEVVEVPDELNAPDDINLGELTSENLNELPDVKEAERLVTSSDYNLKIAKGKSYPTFTVGASLNSGYSSATRHVTGYDSGGYLPVGYVQSNKELVVAPDINPQFSTTPYFDQLENNFGQVLSARLSIPIFNNLQISHGIQTAKIQQSLAELTLQQTKQDLRDKIYSAYVNMMNAYQSYLAESDKLKSQKLLFEQNDLRYNNGLISFYDWQSSKNNLTATEINFLNAKYNYILNRNIVDFYRGKPINLK